MYGWSAEVLEDPHDAYDAEQFLHKVGQDPALLKEFTDKFGDDALDPDATAQFKRELDFRKRLESLVLFAESTWIF